MYSEFQFYVTHRSVDIPIWRQWQAICDGWIYVCMGEACTVVNEETAAEAANLITQPTLCTSQSAYNKQPVQATILA